MGYRHKQNVEILCKEEDKLVSYYSATLLAAIGRNNYLVRYHTRRHTLDKTRLLIESLDDSEVRPVPPRIPNQNFQTNDRVDGYVNGAWWIGRVARKVDPNYYVRLDGTENEVHFAFYNLRVHLDWVNGKWVQSRNRPPTDDGRAKEGDKKS